MSHGESLRNASKAALLRAVVRQFLALDYHSVEEIEQFERLTLGLIDLAGEDDLLGLVEGLCRHPDTPASIDARILDKSRRCALLALEFSERIVELDLLATAEQGAVDYAIAIAKRPHLPREVVAALVSRAETLVLHALALNPSVYFDQQSLRALTQAARDDRALARILLDRDDLDIDPQPLFLAARSTERAAILLQACHAVLSEGAVEAAQRASGTVIEALEHGARCGDFEAIVAVIAEALDCRKGRVRAIVSDEGGEALALTLLSLGVDNDCAVRLFLRCGASIAHDIEKVRRLIALMRSTPLRAAHRLVGAMTGASRADPRDAPRRAGPREEGRPRERRRSATPRARAGRRDQTA